MMNTRQPHQLIHQPVMVGDHPIVLSHGMVTGRARGWQDPFRATHFQMACAFDMRIQIQNSQILYLWWFGGSKHIH